MRISDWSSDVCSSDLTGSCDGCSRGWRHQGSGRVSSCALRVFLLGVLTRIAGGDQAQPALAFDIGLISIRLRCNIRHVVGSPATSICIISPRSEEHTSELQSLMRISYAVFCLKKK